MRNSLHSSVTKIFIAILLLGVGSVPATCAERLTDKPFVHPGLLHTQADFDRMKAKVASGAHPWIDGWNVLIANRHAQLSYHPRPVGTIFRGDDHVHHQNYALLFNDASAAYQTALRWRISGDNAYADKTVEILNAWGSTLTGIGGNTDASLALGAQGYELANAAEIIRDYSGWKPEDIAKFKQMMLDVFYGRNHDFLFRHNNTRPGHYWANWDLCNLNAELAIGVLCDRRDIYDEAIEYFKHGAENGSIEHAVYIMHPGYLGQWQESGRDQGHTAYGVALTGSLCQMAWNQGDDLFGYDNNRVLAGMEYIAKYNLGEPVPYVRYGYVDGWIQGEISDRARGLMIPSWELLYNHYVNLKGISAPNVTKFATKVRPEGGGGDYGPNSGGFDQLGFGTLTYTIDPAAQLTAPSGLTALASGTSVILSWWGSAGATDYLVRRSNSEKGPYTTIAAVTENTLTDKDIAIGRDYYYRVVAQYPAGKTTTSPLTVASTKTALLASVRMNNADGQAIIDNGAAKPVKLASEKQGLTTSQTITLGGKTRPMSLPPGFVNGVTDFSIVLWVNLRSEPPWSRILDFGSDQLSYMYLTPNTPDGKVRFGISTGGPNSEERIDGASPLPLGKPTHVAVTLSGGTGTLYVDGKVAGTTTGMHLSPVDLGATTHNYIGKSQFPDPELEGEVSGIQIYRGVLLVDRIAALATEGVHH